MGSFSDTPALVATGTILPYRFVKISGVNTGAVSATATEIIVGVTDGSTKAFNSGNHCESGDPITLQGGDVVLVYASAAITAGDRVGQTTDGAAVAVTSSYTNKTLSYVALETASVGMIIRCLKCNASLSV